MAIKLRPLPNKLRRPTNATQRRELASRDFLRRQQEQRIDTNANPVITTQPVNLTVAVGSPASFTCIAEGAGDITYQWYINAVLAPGQTNSTINIPSTVIGDDGSTFYCEVTDTTIFNEVTIQSDTATLTVTP